MALASAAAHGFRGTHIHRLARGAERGSQGRQRSDENSESGLAEGKLHRRRAAGGENGVDRTGD